MKIFLTLLMAVVMVLVMGTSLADGSNESSYKFGYKMATDNLTNMITVPSTPHLSKLIRTKENVLHSSISFFITFACILSEG